jgi:hypothetical protein
MVDMHKIDVMPYRELGTIILGVTVQDGGPALIWTGPQGAMLAHDALHADVVRLGVVTVLGCGRGAALQSPWQPSSSPARHKREPHRAGSNKIKSKVQRRRCVSMPRGCRAHRS